MSIRYNHLRLSRTFAHLPQTSVGFRSVKSLPAAAGNSLTPCVRYAKFGPVELNDLRLNN
jgi:hypothetical protein